MKELWLILLAYRNMLAQWLTTRFPRPHGLRYVHETKTFQKGDTVVDRHGNVGKVWRVYVKIKTGKPVACSIVWNEPVNGEKITALVPVEDKSPHFNPIIKLLPQ